MNLILVIVGALLIAIWSIAAKYKYDEPLKDDTVNSPLPFETTYSHGGKVLRKHDKDGKLIMTVILE